MSSFSYALAMLVALSAPLAAAQNVKITPLGSHTGELCDRDRATLFENPSGVRILYDAGHSVTGAEDPRLGDVHVVLLSHAHGDHMGDRRLKAQDAGSCAAPETDPERKNLEADNVSLWLGPPTGYVVQFTNGLRVYLTGDTGIHTEMKNVVNEFHKANLVVFNLGPNAVNSASAAYAVNELIKPAAVVASHVNEAATTGGKLRPDSRTAAFVNLVKGRPVHLALSGKTMEFDGNGKCVAGC